MTPDQYTLQEFFLDVGDEHQLYVHEWGNPKAKTPIIFLHGGPGGHVKDKHKLTFDPSKQRVIFFDQRGCGKSLPYGSLEHNTSAKLVEDISKLADHLKLPKFILTGGSWGAALALYYGIAHPHRLAALVIDGVWTGSTEENRWLDQGRFKAFFPEAWDQYVASVPKKYAHDPSAYHFPRILGGNHGEQKASGYAYETLEGSVMALDDRFTPENPEEFDPTGIRMEVYYLTNHCFVPDRYVFQNAHKLTVPVWMIQGRYDMVCPPVTAHELNKLLPDSHLIWTISGHFISRESWTVKRAILQQLTT